MTLGLSPRVLERVPHGEPPRSLMTAQQRARATQLRATPSPKPQELADQLELVPQMLERREAGSSR